MWLKRRLWPGIAELGMAFAGLVLGYLVVGTVLGAVANDAVMLAGAAAMTAVAALFYGQIGPRWAAAVEDVDDPDPDPEPPPPWVANATTPGAVAVTIVLGVAGALAGSMVVGLLFEWLGVHVKEQARVLEIVAGAREELGPEAVMLVVAALLLAPVTEEWFFLHLLFRRVAARSGRALAFAISAVAFAAIHDNPAGFVVYLWLGLVFAWVLERTGRLWAAIAVHMGNNGYVLVMLFLGGAG
jgi:membrane protease YdiL (CAAX protease family)